MGTRITRAAPHVSEKAVQERMQREQRPWCRRRWEIIDQALTAPRKAEDIAKTVGVSLATVHQVSSTDQRRGVEAIETPGTGGRRRQSLTVEQERTFLQPFVTRAAKGEIATVAEIHQALSQRGGHPVDHSTTSRLLNRQGGSTPGSRVKATASPAPPPERLGMHEETVPGQQRRKQPSQKRPALQKRSTRGSPSDLSDQEWAILDPVIPPAKEGGHPRTTDMREVLNALFSVDRTGCPWRALPHDVPPWSTVWSSFRLWRNDGTWHRIQTALREKTRVRMGREPPPSAAIIASQSVKTSQQGGLAGMTAAKKSKGGRGISSWTPRV